MARPRHHWIVRVTHWVNAIALTIMIGSGLRIFNAYPRFARKGETFCCYPWEGEPIPSWATFGGWLAGARNWHFAMMWVLVVNGLVYLGFVYLHGEWRDIVPRRGFFRNAWEMTRFYLFVRRDHPVQGKHNALQRGTYFLMPWVAAVIVISGIAIWKPVQLAPLTNLMGGYVWARYWHFMSMALLIVLSLIHIFMVFAVDPYSLRAITTGGYNPENSPESRNARPFQNLLPNRFRKRHASTAAAGTGSDGGPEHVDHSRRKDLRPEGKSEGGDGGVERDRGGDADGGGDGGGSGSGGGDGGSGGD